MKNVSIRKRVIAMLLVAAMLVPMAAYFSNNREVESLAAETMVATPTKQRTIVKTYSGTYIEVTDDIPMYAIVQNEQGWVSNYLKLRDLAFYLDYDVQWSADEPDAMYIWTNRHYLEPLNTDMSEPLKTEVATKSTMRMYVDGVEVPDIEPVMINWNNYFKVRDLAKIINFGCIYSTLEYKEGGIYLNAQVPYKDGDLLFTDKNYPEKRVIQYDSPMWFDQSSGQLYDEPVKQLPSNPWAREDWYSTYASDSLKKWANDGGNPLYVQTLFNGLVQVLLDEEKIATDNSGTVFPLASEHNQKNELFINNKLNAYYMYPVCYGGSSSFSVTSLGYCSYDVGRSYNALTLGWAPGTPGYQAIELTKTAAADILAKAETYQTDREKVQYLVEEVCDRIIYSGEPGSAGLTNAYSAVNTGEFWTSGKMYNGVCMDFVHAFEYLAGSANIKWLHVQNTTHEWDLVWLSEERQWFVVDTTNCDYDSDIGAKDYRYSHYFCVPIESYNRDTNLSGPGLLVKEAVETAYRLSK